jgi:hypothetical protein
MDLRPYVDNLRNDFAVAAEASGAEARSLAERLFTQLESAIRLTLLDALSAAADEITRDLAPGSVHVRLAGREPAFVVTPAGPPFDGGAEAGGSIGPPAPISAPMSTAMSTVMSAAMSVPVSAPEGDDGGTSRINLRLPDHLKASVEEAAGRAGLSVNAWMVRAVAITVESGAREHRPEQRPEQRGGSSAGQHITGWVR